MQGVVVREDREDAPKKSSDANHDYLLPLPDPRSVHDSRAQVQRHETERLRHCGESQCLHDPFELARLRMGSERIEDCGSNKPRKQKGQQADSFAGRFVHACCTSVGNPIGGAAPRDATRQAHCRPPTLAVTLAQHTRRRPKNRSGNAAPSRFFRSARRARIVLPRARCPTLIRRSAPSAPAAPAGSTVS